MDQLNILALAVPTTEEISLLRGYPGDKAQLATVEQYFLQVMPIPRLGARIAALVFKGTAESNLRKVTEEYELVAAAALELKGCARFVTVLEGILAVGNHLNGGTYRGQARGFRLETLLRLTDVKAVDRKTSLLHFVAKELKKSAPEVEFLADELKKRRARAALHLDGTKETLDAVEKGLASVNVEVLRASGGESRVEPCGKHRRNARPVPRRHGPVCRARRKRRARARALLARGARRDEKRDGVFRRAVQARQRRAHLQAGGGLPRHVRQGAGRRAARGGGGGGAREARSRRRRASEPKARGRPNGARATAKDAGNTRRVTRAAHPAAARARRARWISWTPCTTSSRRRRRAWTPRSPPPARWRA